MTAQISNVTLGVKDLKRAKDFYAGLGFALEQDHPGFVSFTAGPTGLSLYKREALAKDAGVDAGGSGFTGVVLNYIAPSADQVDEALTQAKQAGGTIVKPAQKAQWGGYFGHFADPDGYIWKVAASS
ncbi:MAG TPA: VOC family protein [Candidatus Acidoferrum sp.]|nr:VOC family protein [Candidatus Acidoferrum sp.]